MRHKLWERSERKVSVSDKWAAFDTVYMHAEETSAAHICKSHASQRYAHASRKGDAYIRRDAWSSSSSLHTLAAYVWSVRGEWQTTAVSCAIRVPDIPAIDPMTYGTCEESCCQPYNLRYVVSEFSPSCGKEWFDFYLCERVNAVSTLGRCSTTACQNPSQLQTIWMMIYVSRMA
jgi:hypothetical protein